MCGKCGSIHHQSTILRYQPLAFLERITKYKLMLLQGRADFFVRAKHQRIQPVQQPVFDATPSTEPFNHPTRRQQSMLPTPVLRTRRTTGSSECHLGWETEPRHQWLSAYLPGQPSDFPSQGSTWTSGTNLFTMLSFCLSHA